MTTVELDPRQLGAESSAALTPEAPVQRPAFEERLKALDDILSELGVPIPAELPFEELPRHATMKAGTEVVSSFLPNRLRRLGRGVSNFASDTFAKFLGNTPPYRDPEEQTIRPRVGRSKLDSWPRGQRRGIAAVTALGLLVGGLMAKNDSNERSDFRITSRQATEQEVDTTTVLTTELSIVETTVQPSNNVQPNNEPRPTSEPNITTPTPDIVEKTVASAGPVQQPLEEKKQQYGYNAPLPVVEQSPIDQVIKDMDLATTMPYALLSALGVHPNDFDFAIQDGISRYNQHPNNIVAGKSLSWREGRIWEQNGSMISPETLPEFNKILIEHRA